MARLARPFAMASAAGAVALAASFALAAPASAATSAPVTFDCQGTPPIGAAQQLKLDTSIQADAPATVDPGSSFEATFAPDPLAVPTDAGGFVVNNLKGLTLSVPVPANMRQ